MTYDSKNNNKETFYGKYKISYKKLFDEYLLIELEDSGVLKIKYSKDSVSVVLYTSQSLEAIQGISALHKELK